MCDEYIRCLPEWSLNARILGGLLRPSIRKRHEAPGVRSSAPGYAVREPSAPVAGLKAILAARPDPTVRNPRGARMRRTSPTAADPDMTAAYPAPVAGGPHKADHRAIGGITSTQSGGGATSTSTPRHRRAGVDNHGRRRRVHVHPVTRVRASTTQPARHTQLATTSCDGDPTYSRHPAHSSLLPLRLNHAISQTRGENGVII